jgi:membrane dipeptidase
MHRRDFSLGILKISAAALISPHLLAQPLDSSANVITTLYKNAVVIDALCAPFINMDAPPTPEVLAAIRQSGITAINFTISELKFEDTVENIAYVEALVEQHPEAFLIVRQHSDIARAKRENKIGIMLGFQYPGFLEQDLDRIELFRHFGVRIMQLTYNNRGLFGDGCLEPGNAGLSKAGIAAVMKMNDLGVAVDLSHSGYRTTAEGISESKKPVLITHSGCTAVYPHPRSKPDEILKSLADRGGFRCLPHALRRRVAHRAHSRTCSQSSRARHQRMRSRSRGHRLRWFDRENGFDHQTESGL